MCLIKFFLYNLFIYGRCYCHSLYWQMLCHKLCQMLVSIIYFILFVTDVQPLWKMLQTLNSMVGWCWCQSDRWNSHLGWNCYKSWQMLLPLWLMEWILGQLLYSFVVVCLFHLFYFILLHSLFVFILHLFVFYFIFSSELLRRTSPQTCGRWYLPTFLIRDGLLTRMYIDSFMNLMRFFGLPSPLYWNYLV